MIIIQAMDEVLGLIRSTRERYLNLNNLLVDLSLDEIRAVLNEVELNENVQCLFLRNNHLSSDAVCAVADHVKMTKKLLRLAISSNPLDERGIRAVAEVIKTNKTLQILDMGRCNLGYQGVQVIADAMKSNNTLLILQLNVNDIGDKGGDAVADMIRNNSSVHTLSLCFNGLGFRGIRSIADALVMNRTIRSIDIINNEHVGDDSAQELLSMLNHNRTLMKLNVRICPISDFLKVKLMLKLVINRHLERVRRMECEYRFGCYSGIHEPGIEIIMGEYIC